MSRFDPMRDQELAYMHRERQRHVDENLERLRETHPFDFEGELHPDASEFHNYVDELRDISTGLDAMGVAFAVRSFRQRPYADSYQISHPGVL